MLNMPTKLTPPQRATAEYLAGIAMGANVQFWQGNSVKEGVVAGVKMVGGKLLVSILYKGYLGIKRYWYFAKDTGNKVEYCECNPTHLGVTDTHSFIINPNN